MADQVDEDAIFCDKSTVLSEINNTDNQDNINSAQLPNTIVDVPSHLQSVVENGQNSTSVLCQRCASVVLRPRNATFTQKQIFLPHMRKKSEQGEVSSSSREEDGETLADHWLVGDMFTFENVGFSNTIGSIKYLICADCEIGPIGWHDINNKTEFYVALGRVEQRD